MLLLLLRRVLRLRDLLVVSAGLRRLEVRLRLLTLPLPLLAGVVYHGCELRAQVWRGCHVSLRHGRRGLYIDRDRVEKVRKYGKQDR